MRIARRVFVVPLANNNHGKSTIVRALVSQGRGKTIEVQRKGVRELTTPWGRPVDAYVFGRSYQEVEKGEHGTVKDALDANDADWRDRELVIMPSHVSGIENDEDEEDDIDQMIDAAHSAGFDTICVSVILTGPDAEDRTPFADIWRKSWDERWTIPNSRVPKPEGQLEAIGHDLWSWVSRALVV